MPIESYPQQASYTVYSGSGKYWAKPSRESGLSPFSGTDAAAVISGSINALTSGRTWKEKIVLKGDFSGFPLSTAINIPSYTIIDIQGKIKFNSDVPSETPFFRNSDFVNGNSNIEIRGGTIDGTVGTSVPGHGRGQVIEFRKGTDFIIEGITFQNASGMCLRNGLTSSTNTGNSYGIITNCRVPDEIGR